MEASTRGRKARACDWCSRLERACNSKSPRAPCISGKKKCTYDRPQSAQIKRSHEQGERAAYGDEFHVDLDSVRDQSTASDMLYHAEGNVSAGIPEENIQELGSHLSSPDMPTVCLDYWTAPWIPLAKYGLAISSLHRSKELDVALLVRFPF